MLATMRRKHPRPAARWRECQRAPLGASAAAVLLAIFIAALPATAAQVHSIAVRPSSQSESLGTLARQVRATHARRDRLHPPRIYTNADLPVAGHISVFGRAPTTAAFGSRTTPAAHAAQQQQAQAAWQQQVTAAQRQLTLDQQALSVTQREWNLSQQQYYSNPNTALQQQYSRSDIHQKAEQVKSLKQKIEADQQHLQDLQDNPPQS